MAHDFTFLRKQTLRDHAREFGYAEAMADEAFEAFLQARNEVVLYDDVLPGLERLKTALPAVHRQQRQCGPAAASAWRTISSAV